MEYNTTSAPIPLISKTNSRLNPSKRKSKLICRDGILWYVCTTVKKFFKKNCKKKRKIKKGTKKMKIPVCILFFNLLIVGTKKAITRGANIAYIIHILHSSFN